MRPAGHGSQSPTLVPGEESHRPPGVGEVKHPSPPPAARTLQTPGDGAAGNGGGAHRPLEMDSPGARTSPTAGGCSPPLPGGAAVSPAQPRTPAPRGSEAATGASSGRLPAPRSPLTSEETQGATQRRIPARLSGPAAPPLGVAPSPHRSASPRCPPGPARGAAGAAPTGRAAPEPCAGRCRQTRPAGSHPPPPPPREPAPMVPLGQEPGCGARCPKPPPLGGTKRAGRGVGIFGCSRDLSLFLPCCFYLWFSLSRKCNFQRGVK